MGDKWLLVKSTFKTIWWAETWWALILQNLILLLLGVISAYIGYFFYIKDMGISEYNIFIFILNPTATIDQQDINRYVVHSVMSWLGVLAICFSGMYILPEKIRENTLTFSLFILTILILPLVLLFGVWKFTVLGKIIWLIAYSMMLFAFLREHL